MERERQRPNQVLASLAKQLASQTLQLCPEIKEIYDRLEPKNERPTFEGLYTALPAASKPFTRVFLLFDALDGCDEGQRKQLLPLFHRLTGNGISVFLTSRPHPDDIQNSLHGAIRIEISAKEGDIRAYIEQRIDENTREKRLVDQGECKDLIISGLVECAKGI